MRKNLVVLWTPGGMKLGSKSQHAYCESAESKGPSLIEMQGDRGCEVPLLLSREIRDVTLMEAFVDCFTGSCLITFPSNQNRTDLQKTRCRLGNAGK